jgi:uncharacterized protein (DUF433 family)
MSPAMLYPHLVVAQDGSVHIGTTRYKVQHLAAEHYHFGWTAEEILRQHPDLAPEEVYASLAYFYDNFDEMTAKIRESAVAVDAARSPVPFSRDDLLNRLRAKGA